VPLVAYIPDSKIVTAVHVVLLFKGCALKIAPVDTRTFGYADDSDLMSLHGTIA
jgi:hypothetical protein